MNFEIAFVLGVLLLAVVLFVTEKLSVDLVALVVMGLLMASGIISASEGLSGFSNSAKITVALMFRRKLNKSFNNLDNFPQTFGIRFAEVV
ncbi:MAG: hypothetical protein ACR2L1_11030 [Pyrinomonadaceae bacterium]